MQRPFFVCLSVLLLAACAQQTPVGGANASSGSPTARVHWIFSDSSEDAQGIPHSAVSVVIEGTHEQTVSLGTVTGTCAEKQNTAAEAFGPDVISDAECWFAGGGDEWQVRQSGSAVRIFHRTVDEGSGDEPAPEQPWVQQGSAVSL